MTTKFASAMSDPRAALDAARSALLVWIEAVQLAHVAGAAQDAG